MLAILLELRGVWRVRRLGNDDSNGEAPLSAGIEIPLAKVEIWRTEH